MTTRKVSIRLAIYALTATAGCFVEAASAQPVINVSGYTNYCSKTWPTGDFNFGYAPNGPDPCQAIDPAHTGTTQRKGLYSSSGWNNTVLRCDQGVWFWTGVGDAPLNWAHNTALQGTKSNCVLTAAPRNLPVFDAPLGNLAAAPGTGFDFARYPYNTLDVTAFGQAGSTTASIVDYRGHDRTGQGFIDDHAGYDWNVPKYTPVYAVADGRVVRAEKYFKSVDNCNNYEAHVYIEHKVCGSNGYCEKFLTYYTHLDAPAVFVGQDVTKGQWIAFSGNSGCVPAHLHFTAARLTNTADKLEDTLVFTDGGQTTFQGQVMKVNVHSNIYNFAIDPFGWEPMNGPDPWGWRVYHKGLGAMSIHLWTWKQPFSW